MGSGKAGLREWQWLAGKLRLEQRERGGIIDVVPAGTFTTGRPISAARSTVF